MSIDKKTIDDFLFGEFSMEHIIKIESSYKDDYVSVVYRAEDGSKRIKKDDLYPFVWSTRHNANKLFDGSKEVFAKLKKAGIEYVILKTKMNETDPDIERLENGYSILFRATRPMSNMTFQSFFKKAGRPIKNSYEADGNPSYISLPPDSMYMISMRNRMFKGYDDYDDLVRMSFDLETEGLDPTRHFITQLGIGDNKGFLQITKLEGETMEEKLESELNLIKTLFSTIKAMKPDVITGHNIENFDFWFIIERLKNAHNTSVEEVSRPYFVVPMFKYNFDSVLKLGGEVEYYKKTNLWGYNITDSLFAVRRAQAIDSNMESSGLKYVTKYSRLEKSNRVYVEGSIISDVWKDKEYNYILNDKNGEWWHKGKEREEGEYLIDEINKTVSLSNSDGSNEHLKLVTGEYIVNRYLEDDLYETDKVELQYNLPNFLVGKMLPVSYEKMCTMGTAAIWKFIMVTWCYENNLAIPQLINRRKFTGGLSRLFVVGFVQNVVKLDYNSLYPSIILSMGIETNIDITRALPSFLEYFLTQREYYKDLKGKHSKLAAKLYEEHKDNLTEEILSEISENKRLAARYDKLQLPIKIIANAYFGSFGSGSVFPFSDMDSAEEVTCTGRMMFRLMCKWFKDIGYDPIVGDSFTSDTPMFYRMKSTGLIGIKSISELQGLNTSVKPSWEVDDLGREYCFDVRDIEVWCNSGWETPNYIYRHKTDKTIHRVVDTERNSSVDVTSDHSLYDDNMREITPTEITSETRLKYCPYPIPEKTITLTDEELGQCIALVKYYGRIKDVLVNVHKSQIRYFIETMTDNKIGEDRLETKTDIALYRYLKFLMK